MKYIIKEHDYDYLLDSAKIARDISGSDMEILNKIDSRKEIYLEPKKQSLSRKAKSEIAGIKARISVLEDGDKPEDIPTSKLHYGYTCFYQNAIWFYAGDAIENKLVDWVVLNKPFTEKRVREIVKEELKSFDDIEYLHIWVKDIQQLIIDLYKPGSFSYRHSQDRVRSFLEGRIKNINKNIKNAGKE